jgi:hypothetical protein
MTEVLQLFQKYKLRTENDRRKRTIMYLRLHGAFPYQNIWREKFSSDFEEIKEPLTV